MFVCVAYQIHRAKDCDMGSFQQSSQQGIETTQFSVCDTPVNNDKLQQNYALWLLDRQTITAIVVATKA